MKSGLKFKFLVLSCVLLGACTFSPTKYSDWRATSVSEEGPNKYEIVGFGNNKTSLKLVESFALLRAAEQTLESGGDKFRLLSHKYEKLYSTVSHVTALRGRRITLIIETNKARQESQSDKKWIDAQKVVDTWGHFHKEAKPPAAK